MGFKFLAIYLLLGLSLISCNSRDPQPELVDPLYQELVRLKSQAETEVKEAEVALTEAKAVTGAVAPQTGQVKYALKRQAQAQERFDKGKQRVNYYQSKIDLRKWQARQEYLQSLEGTSEWPNKKALQDFKMNLDLTGRERAWSVTGRREAEGLKNPQPTPTPAPPEEQEASK